MGLGTFERPVPNPWRRDIGAAPSHCHISPQAVYYPPPMQATLYVDESGQFATSSTGITGLRVVGGVLLPGSCEEHNLHFGPAIAKALSWFPAAHAVEIASPTRVAFALRKATPESLPMQLRHVRAQLRMLAPQQAGNLRAEDPALFEAACAESTRLLDALRAVAAEAFASDGASVVLCAEHDLEPSISRFDPMLRTAVDAALQHCAATFTSESTLDVVYEAGAPAQDPSQLPSSRVVVGPKGRACLHGSPRTAAKTDGLAGLALADVLVHALGPRSRQNHPCSRRDCQAWTLRALRAQIRREFGRPPAALVVVDALRGADILRSVEKGTTPVADARAQLGSHQQKLPRGVLSASLQFALATLGAREVSSS